MSNDRRYGRPHAGRAFLAQAGVALLILSPTAAAQTAEAQPALVAPGAAVALTYRVQATFPVDLGIQERVTCTIQGPGGGSAPLSDAPGALVHVDVAPAEATYAFNVSAPTTPGVYTITFTRARTLDLLGPADPSATTTLVVAAGTPLTPGGGPGAGDGTTEGGEPAGPGAPSATGAQRWLVSTGMGTAALVVMLVGGRWGLGGGP
jgi:hypothetical protein